MNAKKLLKGRLDAIVIEEITGRHTFHAIGDLNHIHYDPAAPIGKNYVYYAFHQTQKGPDLARTFSETLRHMKEDGTFAAIMQPAAGTMPKRERCSPPPLEAAYVSLTVSSYNTTRTRRKRGSGMEVLTMLLQPTSKARRN